MYAWVLQAPERFEEPVPYRHPSGAVAWVNFDPVPASPAAASAGGGGASDAAGAVAGPSGASRGRGTADGGALQQPRRSAQTPPRAVEPAVASGGAAADGVTRKRARGEADGRTGDAARHHPLRAPPNDAATYAAAEVAYAHAMGCNRGALARSSRMRAPDDPIGGVPPPSPQMTPLPLAPPSPITPLSAIPCSPGASGIATTPAPMRAAAAAAAMAAAAISGGD